MTQELPQLSVAPMLGITHFPMRLFLTMTSRPRAMTSPFLKVTRSQPQDGLPLEFAPELGALRGVLPYKLTPQLLAGEAETFMRVAELLPPEVAPVVELNCGCPCPNGMPGTAGSATLADPEAFQRLIKRLAEHMGPGRLAVKMRLGTDDAARFPELIAALLPLPLARVTVHGRTRADGYSGSARWDLIALAANQLTVPVWGSGDVIDEASLEERLKAPIAGAVIGRGLLANPWVFSEVGNRACAPRDGHVLANALLCYSLLEALWSSVPEKIVARVASGRLGAFCGNEASAWERVTAELSQLYFGVPVVATRPMRMPAAAADARLARRMRWLAAHWPLGEAQPPRWLQRSRTVAEICEGLLGFN